MLNPLKLRIVAFINTTYSKSLTNVNFLDERFLIFDKKRELPINGSSLKYTNI